MAASQTFSNLFILGFIYLYASLSVIFGTYQDIETRRSEIQTLKRIGFSNYSILRKYIHERLVSLTFGLLLLFLFFLLIFYPVKASVDSQVGAGFARFPFVEVGTAIVVFIAFLFVSAVSALMKELRLRN
ncbi:FtsX-like permease family protein [Arcanobacterium hippocoleae]